MKVAIVGSSTFPVISTGPALVDFIADLPKDVVVYTRGSKGFDEFVNEVCNVMGIENQKMPGKGGADNFIRDATLVETVDEIHAFFSEDQVGQGGTQHVVDKALDAHKPTHSYSSWGKRFILVGSSEDGESQQRDPEQAPIGSSQASREVANQRARSGEEGQRERRLSSG